jgi:toxin ParE1/3/4
MTQFVIAPAAQRDIESVLAWTEEQFGEQGRLRYEALIVQAIIDISNNPERPGSSGRSEIAAAARTYHLMYSPGHVSVKVGRVKRPRHFLLYRVQSPGNVEIGRVLHDSVDLERHLPPEYRH